ncbi:HEAT repeat domain-containing protein [Nocardia sp. R16R-3T]
MEGGSSPLNSALMSGDPDRQVDALIELIKLGDGRAVADILPLVESDDVAVRSEAARAIGYLGVAQVPVVGPVLLRMLSDADEMVRNEAAEALCNVRYNPAVDILVNLLRADPSWLVRASVAEALGSYPGHGTAALIECVRDLDEYGAVRRYAIDSLGRTGQLTRTELSALAAEFGHDEEIGPQVRIVAYRAGDQSQLVEISREAAHMDQEDSARLLNGIEYLLRPPVPPTLSEDSAYIKSILDVVAMRWPLSSRHVEQIADMLP